MGGMAEFFAELKRRHIYRVGAAYVVVAWAVTQVIDVMSQVFELPGSIARPVAFPCRSRARRFQPC